MIIMVVEELIPLLTFTFMVLFMFMLFQIVLHMTPNTTGFIGDGTVVGLTHNE